MVCWAFHRQLCAIPLLTVLFSLLCAFPARSADKQSTSKNVLVLFSGIGTDDTFLNLIEPVIRSRVREPVTFYDAYLVHGYDEKSEKLSLESEAETFRRTYAGVKLDVVIAISAPAMQFAVQYRDKLFPGTPIVITEVDRREIDGPIGPGITGVTISMGIAETIDLALRLHPDTKRVAVISSPGSAWLPVTRSELQRRQDKVQEIDFVEPASSELLQKVSALPPHTIVLFQLAPAAKGTEFGALELLDAVVARFPTYSAWPTLCLNHGCIGGAYGSPKQISATGEIVARVLLGERPEDIPIVSNFPPQDTVDWRALRRWHIPESALPLGTAVLYRELSVWERYWAYIVAAAAVLVLLLGLLLQWARKRKAEAVLRESEKRFRLMADSTPSLIWMCDEKGKITYLNEQWATFAGLDAKTGYGDDWVQYIHPDDAKGLMDSLSTALQSHRSFSVQHRLRRRDGSYRWMFNVASVRVNGDASFAGFIGSAVDVTDQKMAQMELEKVSGQLIDAQEKERSRLARELHDDICQRLAMLSLKIEKVSKGWARGQANIADQLEQIWQQCSNLTGDVQALSHELHPSILDNLGLVTAVRSFCSEVSEETGVTVDFVASNIPEPLGREVSLSLFRVVQEALHNAIKYSGQKHFEVHLEGSSNELSLEIRDQGVGFDPANKHDGGLGLLSMAERIHQVNGTFNVDSHPNSGTCIRALVPLTLESKTIPSRAN